MRVVCLLLLFLLRVSMFDLVCLWLSLLCVVVLLCVIVAGIVVCGCVCCVYMCLRVCLCM